MPSFSEVRSLVTRTLKKQHRLFFLTMKTINNYQLFNSLNSMCGVCVFAIYIYASMIVDKYVVDHVTRRCSFKTRRERKEEEEEEEEAKLPQPDLFGLFLETAIIIQKDK